MKLLAKLTFLLFFSVNIGYSQEPQRLEHLDSIINVINNSTKGLRFVLSDTGINSELSEVGTTFFMNKYVILSNKKRRHYTTTYNDSTKTFNNNLYCVNVDQEGNLSFPLLFSSALDSDKEEGSIAFTPNQKTIFYTQENTSKPGTFDLYKAELDLNSKDYWTNVQKVENLIPAGYSIETPTVSADGKKLFFASNMPGGFGGFDLYEVAINENGSLGNLKNLGSNINTKEDEKFPNTTKDNKYLFFSSKGHLNTGGFDVFKSSIVNNEYLPALNLGTSINTRKDDQAFILVDEDKGYISSEKAPGDFDILKFKINRYETPNKTYQVVEKETLTPLPNAKVVLKDEFGNIVSEAISNDKGEIKLPLNPISYNTILVNKEGYLPVETMFTSENILSNPIKLEQDKPVVTEDAIVIESIYFEFNKATITKESQLSLNKIVNVLNEYPEMRLDIGAHTDNKGSDKYNIVLSQKRAKSTVDYLTSKGISRDRLTYKGYGESKPLIDCGGKCTAEEDQKNRRVEFNIVKNTKNSI
ncbi:MAG: OmpA family protein [Flavobacteriaceae bacterium]|nr:OmpA family protein [Flavobacteriaceae bacterium]